MTTKKSKRTEKETEPQTETDKSTQTQVKDSDDINQLIQRISATPDAEQRKKLMEHLPESAHVKLMIAESRFAGPLPPADQLQKYEEVMPGAADRIFKMAEDQAHHRQEMEATVIKSNSRDSMLGVIFAFILGLVIIGGGIYLAIKGHKYGPWLTLGGAAGLISVFIYGTRSSKKERVEKDKTRKDK